MAWGRSIRIGTSLMGLSTAHGRRSWAIPGPRRLPASSRQRDRDATMRGPGRSTGIGGKRTEALLQQAARRVGDSWRAPLDVLLPERDWRYPWIALGSRRACARHARIGAHDYPVAGSRSACEKGRPQCACAGDAWAVPVRGQRLCRGLALFTAADAVGRRHAGSFARARRPGSTPVRFPARAHPSWPLLSWAWRTTCARADRARRDAAGRRCCRIAAQTRISQPRGIDLCRPPG